MNILRFAMQVERFLERHGRKTIVVGRFIGPVRALAPFVAGSSRMPAARFVPATFVAAGIWSATFSVLGYLFWHSFAQATAAFDQAAKDAEAKPDKPAAPPAASAPTPRSVSGRVVP